MNSSLWAPSVEEIMHSSSPGLLGSSGSSTNPSTPLQKTEAAKASRLSNVVCEIRAVMDFSLGRTYAETTRGIPWRVSSCYKRRRRFRRRALNISLLFCRYVLHLVELR